MSSGCSNSRSTTSVAACEKREKLTPFGNVVTPIGCAEPGSVSNGTMPCHLSMNVTTRSSELTTGEGRLFDAARQRLERKHQLEMTARETRFCGRQRSFTYCRAVRSCVSTHENQTVCNPYFMPCRPSNQSRSMFALEGCAVEYELGGGVRTSRGGGWCAGAQPIFMGDRGCARAPDCRVGWPRYGQAAATILTDSTLNLGPRMPEVNAPLAESGCSSTVPVTSTL